MLEEKLNLLLSDEVPSKQHEILDTALELVFKVPCVQDRAMEVISDYVKFAYKSVEAAVDEEWDRDSVVERVEASVSSLSKLIDYNSSIWSFTIVKWVLSLLKSLSEERGSSSTTVEADVKYWVTHVTTKSICSLLTTCLENLLAMDAALATTFILDQVLGQNSLYEWIFAYIMSLHPEKLVPCLLKTVFSGRVESSRAVFQMLEFAARSSKSVVEGTLGDLLKNLLDKDKDSEILPVLSFFYKLMTHSHPLVNLILPDFLRLCSPLKLYELTSQIWKSRAFPHNMIPAVIGALYSLPDDLLMEVLHLLLESHAYWDEQKVEDSGEENMEEGELPDMEDTSKEYAFVINPIAQTLNQLIRNLHDTHVSVVFRHKPSKHTLVIEFMTKLQNKSTLLVDWYLEDCSETKSSWLHLVLVVVCQSSPDIIGGRVFAYALSRCSPDRKLQFSRIASLILEVQDVCPGVMNFCVSSVLSDEQFILPGLSNLRALMEYTQHHLSRLRAPLTASLQHNTPMLIECLQQGRASQSILWILTEVNSSLLPYSLQTMLASVLLKTYFTEVINSTKRVAQGLGPLSYNDTIVTLILPIMSKLLHNNCPLTSFVCQTLVKTIIQPEMGGYMSRTPLLTSPVRVIHREKTKSLFSQHQAEQSKQTETQEVKDPHSGTLGSRRIRSLSLSSRGFASTDTQTLAIAYCLEQVLTLVYECCHGNQAACQHFVQGILSHVAPMYPPNKSALDVSEEMQKVTMEWNLAIKKQMENYPVFWHVLHLVTEEDPSSLAVFKGVMVSLVTLLCSHWGQSRLKMASDSPKELDASCHIVELCRKAKWVQAPLSRIDQLLELVSPFEAHLLLNAILDCLKKPLNDTESSETGDSQSKFESALKSVVRNNARQLGPLFSMYYPSCNKFIKSKS